MATLLTAACPRGVAGGEDGGPLAGEGEGEAGATLCEVQAVFTRSCVGCHDGSSAFPDLREGATAATVGLASELHPERVLVVAGDPDASFLYAKLTAVGADDGELMPVGGELSAVAKATVRAWIAAGASSSCATEGEGEGEGGGEGEGEVEPDDTACSILSVRCATCHNGGAIVPDLRPAAQAALLNAPSPGYPGETLVLPGDPDASFLVQKMAGTQAASQRGIMPPGGAVAADELAAVRDWIRDGAPERCAGVEPPPPPPPLEPGGDVSGHIANPSLVQGYTATVPSSASGTCSTGQWWQLRNVQSRRMHPGKACLACHIAESEGPRSGFLGTVTQAADDADDCRGVGDVRVEILDDGDGSVVASGTANDAGNFIIESTFARPYRVRLSLDGRTREMLTPQTDHDCNACHTAEGAEGAPGRVVAP